MRSKPLHGTRVVPVVEAHTGPREKRVQFARSAPQMLRHPTSCPSQGRRTSSRRHRRPHRGGRGRSARLHAVRVNKGVAAAASDRVVRSATCPAIATTGAARRFAAAPAAPTAAQGMGAKPRPDALDTLTLVIYKGAGGSTRPGPNEKRLRSRKVPQWALHRTV